MRTARIRRTVSRVRVVATAVPALCLLTGLLVARSAAADAKGEACVKAFEAGQEHRRKGNVSEALRDLEICSKTNCPDVLRIPCATWKNDLENARPVIAFSITDETGAPASEGEVSVDGKPPVSPSTEVPVDPGPHTIRATHPDRPAQEVTVTVATGEKHRVSIAFAAPVIVSKTSSRVFVQQGPPTITYVLGAVSAAGLASFIGFGLGGRTEQKRLEDTCSPRCTDADTKTGERRYLIADASLGVSLVSAGLATYFALRKRPEPVPTAWDVRVDARPGLAGLGLSKHF
jgi:hypothetical protein